MNDFDFEELDKAVTALDTKTQDEHGISSTGVDMTPSVAASPTPEARPEPPKVEIASAAMTPVAVEVPAKRRLEVTPPKRRGSFMDIVPPHSQRKTPTRVGVSVQPVSKPEDIIPELPKEEPSLPLGADVAPSVSAETAKEEAPMPATAESAAPKLPEAPKTDEAAWPDPLDFHDDQPEVSSAPEVKPELEPAAAPTSPFLAEAKVEKRPLGAFSSFKPVETSPPAEEESPVTPVPERVDAPVESETAPLPPKSNDIVSEEDSSTSPDLHNAAMMSIPQQYRTESKPTDKAPRPVFDTKEYHPPLLESATHDHRGGGSMWGKLFIAFVAVALLAVAGYFVYLYFFM